MDVAHNATMNRGTYSFVGTLIHFQIDDSGILFEITAKVLIGRYLNDELRNS